VTPVLETVGQATAVYALRLGDDALILSHRLAEWVACAPELEEDVALANISLDLLGQARVLLTYAGELGAGLDSGRAGSGRAHTGGVDGAGGDSRGGGKGSGTRTEDDLAYLRDERAFVNCLLVEQPRGDFATTIARQLFFSTYQLALYDALQHSADQTLAGVAGKAVKEVAYHRDHATMWTLRLGDGTDHSHERMQAAVNQLWPYVDELFDGDELTSGLADAGIGIDPPSLRPSWAEYVRATLAAATLEVPDQTTPLSAYRGGRAGRHTEAFGYLLAEMQHVHRSFPGATW
jgi:ring-1,2-phenylacetyl-CoA epoxidase subunit PaaC